jgi:4-hydroxythreonine-4-phosphate dehydrogenase
MDVLGISNLNMNAFSWGNPTVETGRAMIDYVICAIDLALAGRIDAMVTAPINKAAMRAAGIDLPGHTELLATRTQSSLVAMMLAGKSLRVVLVTIHMPLSQVAAMLSVDAIGKIITLTDASLKTRFGIAAPRIAVAGLNPHAGETGLFGDEESRLISPAVQQAKRSGIDASGPHPPDTVFVQAVQGDYDAVVCMYHDQGLIPFKLLHFKDGVNTTLGLPFVRTSVDHGTAYDIAGTGKANVDSMLSAIEMAAHQARFMRARAQD